MRWARLFAGLFTFLKNRILSSPSIAFWHVGDSVCQGISSFKMLQKIHVTFLCDLKSGQCPRARWKWNCDAWKPTPLVMRSWNGPIACGLFDWPQKPGSVSGVWNPTTSWFELLTARVKTGTEIVRMIYSRWQYVVIIILKITIIVAVFCEHIDEYFLPRQNFTKHSISFFSSSHFYM